MDFNGIFFVFFFFFGNFFLLYSLRTAGKSTGKNVRGVRFDRERTTGQNEKKISTHACNIRACVYDFVRREHIHTYTRTYVHMTRGGMEGRGRGRPSPSS